MTKIILGSLLMVMLVSTLTGLVLAKEELRGCPRCGSDSNLRVLRYRLWSWWLSQFDGSIHRAQCLHCKWKGLMRH